MFSGPGVQARSRLGGRLALRVAAGACILAFAGCVPTGADGGGVVRSVSHVAPGQVGLEVVRWQIQDDELRMESALRAHGVPAAALMDDVALRENGFLVWPVRRADLNALLRDMGGSYQDVRTWFGQAVAWRELATASTTGVMLEVDGVARERPGAIARLMVRSWPLPMEDGTRIAVLLVPQIVQDASQASLLRHGERLTGDVITSCAAELELDRDVAWVITCDPSKMVELRQSNPNAPSATPPPLPLPLPPEEIMADPPPALGAPPAPDSPASPAPPAAGSPASAPPALAPPPSPPPAHAEPRSPRPTPPVPPESAAPPPITPPSAPPPRPRARPPLDAPPLENPAPPSRKGFAAREGVLAALLATQDVSSETSPFPRRSTTQDATRVRVLPLGVLLLLAAQEGAGLPSRRTVLVLVPHLDGAPFPAAIPEAPMTP